MKKFIVVITLGFLLLVGCTEEQMQKVDKATDTVQTVTEGGEAVLDSPIGGFVPPDVQATLRLGGVLAMALVLAWREWRGRQAKKAVKEIATGIEIAKKEFGNPTKEPIAVLKESLAKTESITTELAVKKAKSEITIVK